MAINPHFDQIVEDDIVRLREMMHNTFFNFDFPTERMVETNTRRLLEEAELRAVAQELTRLPTPEEDALSRMTLEECQRHLGSAYSELTRRNRPYDVETYRILVAQPLMPQGYDPDNPIDPDYISTVVLTLAQVRNRRDQLLNELNEQEYPEMPPTYQTTTATSARPQVSIFGTSSTISTGSRPVRPTIFQMRQNTHEIELRALREKYPREVFNYDFAHPMRRVFGDLRDQFSSHYKALRRLTAARTAMLTAPPKDRKYIKMLMENNFSSRDLAYLFAQVADVQSTRTYRDTIETFYELRNEKIRYMDHKRRYGRLQAEHNQQAAMIRQKPERYIAIDMEQIATTISTWDHVWGVDYYISNAEKSAFLRIGLCNIRMEESSPESAYANPESILLAPFYITIKLSAIGKATCPTRDGNTLGLSRNNNPGYCAHDIHPHQLSDQPCFGSFGQTLVDQANNGDLISYVGTLIAFYSQYNSQDSAGVAAQYYHPSYIQLFQDPAAYNTAMFAGINAYKQKLIIHREKLQEAIAAYAEYHTQCREADTRIQIAQNQVCYSCDEIGVGDDDEYYNDHNMNRICAGCWMDHYCSECERHAEDCRCEPDED
jgi:hypothetical protein